METEPPQDAAAPVATSQPKKSDPAAQARQEKLRRQFQRALGSHVFGEVKDADTRALLSDFRMAEAIALTQKRAATGASDALALLSQMHETCRWRNWDGAKRTRAQSDEAAASARANAATLPAELQENIEVALEVERQAIDAWLDACADTQFDGAWIERQLRDRAEAGDEVSLRALADMSVTRPEDRLRLLRSAALLGNRDAVVDVASALHQEVTHDNNLAHLEEMKQWLDAAAKISPHGKYLLGDCLLKGCGGLAPEVERGLALLREAARQGDGFALKELADVITAPTGSFTGEEQYAWLTFEARMRDTGCGGPANYVVGRIDNWQRLQSMERGLSPYALAKGKLMGEQYWNAYGTQALAGCGRGS